MCINPKHINTIGLIFDIFGAFFVAKEVVTQFHGQKYEKDPSLHGADKPPWDSSDYKKWEASKYKFMKLGLTCLIIGFILQIVSNYICLPSTYFELGGGPKKTNAKIIDTSPKIAPPQKSQLILNSSPDIKQIPPTAKQAIKK